MIVSLLTDYGLEDDFVGVCHGVILRICPEARIVDVTHGIARHDVRHGAVVLRNAVPYLPVGVNVAVVDPQVGTERRAVAVKAADGRLFVGPDNGVLSLAIERSGGAVQASDVTRSPLRLEPVSASFHGRDVFCPVAAHLAAGADLAEVGEPLGAEELAVVRLTGPRTEGLDVVAKVLLVDRFGNIGLDLAHEQLSGTGLTLGSTIEIEARGERYLASFAATFADVSTGAVVVYEDSYRMLSIAINRGDAASTLQISPDDTVRLRPR